MSIWLKYGTLTGTTIPIQSRPGSNGNKVVLQTPQISKTGTSPPDAVQYYLEES